MIKWFASILAFTIEEVFQTLKSSALSTKKIVRIVFSYLTSKNIRVNQQINFDNDTWQTLVKIKMKLIKSLRI